MKAINRRGSALGFGGVVFFTAAMALAQAGGEGGGGAGESTGGVPSEGGAPTVDPDPMPGTKLGSACTQDQDCQDANTPDLQCITATDAVLADGAPPHGLCSSPCTMGSDECESLSVGAVCFPFTESADSGYCVEGCFFGEPEVGDLKCHGREDFACSPALVADTEAPCATNASCEDGELCREGTCHLVFPACLPSCRGDIDCEAGTYCDQSFLSGVCVAEKPTGKSLGEVCTVEGEPDECLGFCQADSAGSTQGHCATTCGLGNTCAWNSESEKFDGICFYGSVLTNETGSLGDFGFCTPSCNCNAECNDASLQCSELSAGRLNEDFRGPGLCFSAEPGVIPLNECAAGGADGGGGSNGTGGTIIRGGSSGTPAGGDPSSSEGGAPSKPGGGGGAGSGDDSSGCGCKLTPTSSSSSGAGLLLLLAGLALRRRRERA